MNTGLFLRNNLKNISPSLGKILNLVPYQSRPGIGNVYKLRKDDLASIEFFNASQKQEFVFARIRDLVQKAYRDIPFYRSHYDRHGFHPDGLNDFTDLRSIPSVSKQILQGWDIEDRSFPIKGRYVVNTGGSSGTPFGFYIQPESMGHEWAHMHTVWSKLGYKPTDLKLAFGGRSDLKKVVEYDVVRNHFAIDIYADYALVAIKLKQLVKNYQIKYLHGYPSSIYDFALYCQNEDPELRQLLSSSLKGAFLGSEFPHRQYRDVIEEVFGIDSVSWYGHTERAVLAYEKHEKFIYEPFLSYGYSEAVMNDEGEHELVATSYYNNASPLIRYNTGDIISKVKTSGGILESFQITKGRDGEFVLDKSGKKINLTGLIFGRHHELFNYSKFIQVKQVESGVIEIYFVSDSKTSQEAPSLFDTQNLNFDISFINHKEPIRTKSGKINLLIK
jgi:phenylacetate-CoA ligase